MLKMKDQSSEPEVTSKLVDEMIHSILFLGKIKNKPLCPKDIFDGVDDDNNHHLKEKYPNPFKFYSSQLPRRSPFSCMLDMIVHLKQQNDENGIKDELAEIISKLKDETRKHDKELSSTVLCVSHVNNTDSVKYYGVSMSTSGKKSGRIMIAASCLSFYWDEYVAGAVMTFYPDLMKKPYFDGTFNLSRDATCRAYNIKNKSEMKPCKSCSNLFGFQETDPKVWPYGNCAEVESLSKLFKNDDQVKQQSRPQSDTFTPDNIEKVKDETRKKLKEILNMTKFEKWSGEFYDPSVELTCREG
ncbi:uncharacterized protein LOC103132381 [Poecilia formosa]|uniref:uncharacterized protein LOC103132381 n=1 Tax=Poecilia formosa TaxID=48698 RepID=UPI0007BA0B58|nr:PREDICTED: uncharacterized protein LOC103132381 [Poecilia formosa]